MKSFIIFFLLINEIWASSLILYPQKDNNKLKDYLSTHYKVEMKDVFSPQEKKLIHFSKKIQNAFKISASKEELEEIKKDKKINESTFRVEKNQSLQYYSDEYYQYQWALNNSGTPLMIKLTDIDTVEIKAKRAEDIQNLTDKENDRNVLIAVVDSGIDWDHPDLKNKIYTSKTECDLLALYTQCLENKEQKICDQKYATQDSDKNGYPMDCRGWNVAAPVNELTGIQGNHKTHDQIGHGTFVSGVIAAEKNNIGVRGVLSNVKILPVKVSGSDEEVEEDNATDIFAKGILYAIKNDVDIINLSVGWASNEDSLLVTEIINEAHAKGIIVVVAGGNSAHSAVTYPCSYHEVICVGSHNPDGSVSHFSNRGSTIDLMAPGRRIISTWPLGLRPTDFTRRHGYEYKDGTSFSAPYVAAAIGKLINLGHTPEEAKFKIIKGARRKSQDNRLTLNGNLDIKQASEMPISSFIYPYKKTPALINWNKQTKKIRVRLKNYIQSTTHIEIKIESLNEQIKWVQNTVHYQTWKRNEIKDIDFTFKAPPEVDSEMIFKLSIKTKDETKSYPMQANAVTVIHEEFQREDTHSISLKSRVDLSQIKFKVFENINPSLENDFLLIDDTTDHVRFALMKKVGDDYRTSPFMKTPLEAAYISHAARIDLDEDGEQEYVIFAFQKNAEEEWETLFFVFNKNFRPSQYKLTQNNLLKNDITTMTSKIFWIKRQNRIVPSWVSTGYLPAEDMPIKRPFEAPYPNNFEKRFYYLGLDRVHSEIIQIDNEEYLPHSIFPQSRDQKLNFNVNILVQSKDIYLKRYFLFDSNKETSHQEFYLPEFQDLSNKEAIQANDSNALIFSEHVPADQSTFVTLLDPGMVAARQTLLTYPSIFDPIQMIFSKNQDHSFFALTKYNLLYLKEGISYITESRNTDRLVQYKKVRGRNAVYLPSEHTPGFSSEFIEFSEDKLIRNPQYRFLPYGSCSEIGFHSSFWSQENSVIFYCDKNKTVHFINL